jgi:hypothetical protein
MFPQRTAPWLAFALVLQVLGCSPTDTTEPPPFAVALPSRRQEPPEKAPVASSPPEPVPVATTGSLPPSPPSAVADAGASPPPDKHVFVTSNRYGGDLVSAARSRGAPVAPVDGENAGAIASLVGATDFLCNLHAQAANLTGTYRAFIAIPSSDAGPSQRAIDRIRGEGPWKRLDGLVVFPSRASLIVGPAVPISITEYGREIGDGEYVVWTGTGSDGGAASRNDSCLGWSFGEGGFFIPVRAAIALAARTGTEYMFTGYAQCNSQARLYCFEE